MVESQARAPLVVEKQVQAAMHGALKCMETRRWLEYMEERAEEPQYRKLKRLVDAIVFEGEKVAYSHEGEFVSQSGQERMRAFARRMIPLVEKTGREADALHAAGKLTDFEHGTFLKPATASLPPLERLARFNFEIRPIPKRVDLNEFLKSEFPSVTFTDSHGLRVTYEKRFGRGALVRADPSLLREVFRDLKEDATMHPKIRQDENLRVVASTFRRNGSVILQLVSKGAKPIPQRVLPRIGVDVFTTRVGGRQEVHGVGKINVKEIALAHGGNFEALNYGRKKEPALRITLPAWKGG